MIIAPLRLIYALLRFCGSVVPAIRSGRRTILGYNRQDERKRPGEQQKPAKPLHS